MKIEICNSYEDISLKAKNIIIEELIRNRSLLFCAATGGSPTRMYELLVEEYRANPELFSQMQTIKLDEWGGVSMKHEGTCEAYLQKHLIAPLSIGKDRYISFQSNSENPEGECERVQRELNKKGSIDICLLGLGMNGHIALNEPADFLYPHCHVANLTEQSLQHPMLAVGDEKPTYGLTLGLADILQSKQIILLINGEKKKNITKQFLRGEISNHLPASFLWLHPNVNCLIDNEAAGI